MTLVLGAIAGLLLVAIIATIVMAGRDDHVVDFTLPADLNAAGRLAQSSPQAQPLMAGTTTVGISETDQILAETYSTTQRESTLADFYPGNLGVGTTLTYRGVDSTIFGVLSFGSGDGFWQDYLAEHAEGQWWRFGVEPDRGMKLAAYEPRDLGVEPGPDVITYDGHEYRIVESGSAEYRSAGQTGRQPTGTYSFYDYEHAGVLLGFERFDGLAWVSSIGHKVNPQAVTVCNALPPTT